MFVNGRRSREERVLLEQDVFKPSSKGLPIDKA